VLEAGALGAGALGAGALARPVHVAVVGGGISGLAAAHRLRTLLGPGARITLVDRAERLGGVLRTVDLAGVPMDVGAEAFLARRPEVPALAAELGLTDRLARPSGASATVRAGGRTIGLPGRTVLGVPGSTARLDDLLSPSALARAVAERELALDWDGADRSVGELLRARFGDELTDRLVDPLLSGVYAGRVDGLGLPRSPRGWTPAPPHSRPPPTPCSHHSHHSRHKDLPASRGFRPGESGIPSAWRNR
jgi:oxygen-dependent protoporphyrinogen oxidase